MDKYANKPAGKQERKPKSKKGSEVPATCIYSLHARGFRKEILKKKKFWNVRTPQSDFCHIIEVLDRF